MRWPERTGRSWKATPSFHPEQGTLAQPLPGAAPLWWPKLIRDTSGFTFTELLVVITLIAALSAISMTSLIAYNKSSVHRDATRETVAILRNAQVRAVSEARQIECRFTNTPAPALEIYRGADRVNLYALDPNLRWVLGVSNGVPYGFTHSGEPAGSHGHPNCFFYAKGSATPGRIGIERIDKESRRYIELEGLTARVSYCADPSPAVPCPS